MCRQKEDDNEDNDGGDEDDVGMGETVWALPTFWRNMSRRWAQQMRVGEENEHWKKASKTSKCYSRIRGTKCIRHVILLGGGFSLALASMDSCLLEDFHLKPTPVMGDDIRLHLARKVKLTDVGENRHTIFDRILCNMFCCLCYNHCWFQRHVS